MEKSIDAQEKVELKIPQLTIANMAQLGRHQTIINTRSEHYSPRVTGSIPVTGNLFTQIVHAIVHS